VIRLSDILLENYIDPIEESLRDQTVTYTTASGQTRTIKATTVAKAGPDHPAWPQYQELVNKNKPEPKERSTGEAVVDSIYRGVRAVAGGIAQVAFRVMTAGASPRSSSSRAALGAQATLAAATIGAAIYGAIKTSGMINQAADVVTQAIAQEGHFMTAPGTVKFFTKVKGYELTTGYAATAGALAWTAGAGVAVSAAATANWADTQLRARGVNENKEIEVTKEMEEELAKYIATIDDTTVKLMRIAIRAGIVDEDGNITDDKKMQKILIIVRDQLNKESE
jgi:hypothetical protein